MFCAVTVMLPLSIWEAYPTRQCSPKIVVMVVVTVAEATNQYSSPVVIGATLISDDSVELLVGITVNAIQEFQIVII